MSDNSKLSGQHTLTRQKIYKGLDRIYLPMELTDWPLGEVALLLIGLTQKIPFVKNWL
jgi:hypothetical protein